MRFLLRLKPYLLRYKKTLLLGLLTVIGSNIFTVVQPMFLGKAVDELKRGIELAYIHLQRFTAVGRTHRWFFSHCRHIHILDTSNNYCHIAAHRIRFAQRFSLPPPEIIIFIFPE